MEELVPLRQSEERPEERPVVKIGAVVVRPDRPRFPNRTWVTLFDNVTQVEISRLAKAALLDLISSAARTAEGILVASVSDIDAPRSSAYRAVAELSRAGLVVRKKHAKIYLNPELVYAGQIQRYTTAVEAWQNLLGGEDGGTV